MACVCGRVCEDRVCVWTVLCALQVWRQHFLAPARAAAATLVVGEWGGRYTDLPDSADELWQDTFRDFLRAEGLGSFCALHTARAIRMRAATCHGLCIR